MLGHTGRRAVRLAAHAEDAGAVCVFVLDREMIEHVAVHWVGPHLPTTHAVGLHRRAAHGPIDDIEVVNVLLDDVIAGEPGEEQPVANLPFHVGPRAALVLLPVVLGPVDPKVAHVPIALPADDLADRTLFDAVHRFDVDRIVAALRAGDDAEALRRGEFRRRHDLAYADRSDRDGLLHEHVLAGVDRRRQMLWAKVRRRGENHHVDIAREHFLVSVKAEETRVGRGRALVRPVFLATVERVRDAVLEQIAERNDLDVGRRIDAVERRAGPASAGADQPDADLVGDTFDLGEERCRAQAASGPRAAGEAERSGRRSGERRAADEVAA